MMSPVLEKRGKGRQKDIAQREMSASREEKEQSKQRKIVVKLEMRNKQQTNLKIREEMET